MSKRRTAKPAAMKAEPSETAPSPEVIERPDIVAEIRLVVPRLNAHKVLCPAGTVIAPDVDGWPDARVALHLRHGHAEVFHVEPESTE